MCFPLNNEINASKTDSAVKAAFENTSDYSDVDVCTSSAVKSSHVYLYSTLCSSLNSSSFMVLNMKNQSPCLFQLELQLDFLL